MATVSVNTNVGAMVALQNLNKTNKALNESQTRINTGLKVASAKDNGAIYAIAQSQRSDVKALNAVTESLNRAVSIVDVALAAGEGISDILIQMKEITLAAQDTGLDDTARATLAEDFEALRNQIRQVSQGATFNGVNIIDGSQTSVSPLSSTKGDKMRVEAKNLDVGGTIVTLSSAATFASVTAAAAQFAAVELSLKNVSGALSSLGTASKQISSHITFVSKLSDSMEAGIGNLVDADLAKESAKLQSLQTKQQLGIQALSIANQAPQMVLSLFGQ
ncbi:flagellin [Asticcacaulis tiandongensis]|uniref:flagellin n=1 Tax=Asticcacaulis tiandongensis TaxID=2565365 RepID=UPI00112E00EF|nr:flagellin [Asticcacaulis tiandongensis]